MISELQQLQSEAARLSDDDLRGEILRCMRGERIASSEFERQRFELRISVFHQHLKNRLAERHHECTSNHHHA